jgi:crotonobetainyl-CoA:carnitine CoA-transferase CaiB-like acyl-CoA transferase
MTPLKGVRVLDLSKVLAGPLCGQYLGELGADVIKVEPPGCGDDTRSWLPLDRGESATFLAVNHNKRSVAVDMKTPEGRQIVHALVAKADIVLQGFGGGTAEKLGVDYQTLSAINPALIYCEFSGYGQTGPMGGQPGYDVMLQAFSGMISSMGDPEGTLTRASFSPVDLGTGMHAVSGVLAAYIERLQTGKGVFLEATLLDTAIGFMAYHSQNYWRSGRGPERMGTGHPALCPYQVFEAADGPLMIGIGNDPQWRRFCELADLQKYMQDPAYATNADRVRNFQDTVDLVAFRIRLKPRQHWLDVLPPARIPCSPIQSLPDALAHPQVEARGLVVCSEHPIIGRLSNIAYPVRFNHERRESRCAPPLLGQHTNEVLQELGFDTHQIAQLLESGAVQASGRAVPAQRNSKAP